MLTARTKDGKKLCLGYPYNKETLLFLRRKEEFFCPLCGERVVLKLGDQKIYHFAHIKGGNCSEFSEKETEVHMQGKLKLFRWLKRQKIPAELEYYDRTIKQRPDILFYYEDKKIALEYQCSTISEQIFTKRTDNYLKHGYYPLWIIGESSLKEHSIDSASLSNFHYLFLRQTKNGQLFIPSYSPEKNLLQIYYSIFPYSAKNALLKRTIQLIDKVQIPFLLNPPINICTNAHHWKTMNERYMMKWLLYPNAMQRNFLLELYSHHLNLFLLPPEIGIPVAHACLIRTPPFIWQTYYFLDILHNRHPGEKITMVQIEKNFLKRIHSKEIQTRTIPQAANLNPLLAYSDYSCFFVKQGVLIPKGDRTFQVLKTIEIPMTNREKEERTASFYQQNPFYH